MNFILSRRPAFISEERKSKKTNECERNKRNVSSEHSIAKTTANVCTTENDAQRRNKAADEQGQGPTIKNIRPCLLENQTSFSYFQEKALGLEDEYF